MQIPAICVTPNCPYADITDYQICLWNQVQVAQTDENKNRQAPEKDKTLEKVAEKSKDKKPCQFCKKEFINLKLHHAKNEKCKKFLQENAGWLYQSNKSVQ